MLAETLFGFACLIANGDAKTDQTVAKAQKIVESLSAEKQALVQQTISSGACLPNAFEQLIAKTRVQVEMGIAEELQAAPNPTHGCH